MVHTPSLVSSLRSVSVLSLEFPLWSSGIYGIPAALTLLRIPSGPHSCGIGHSCSSDLITGLGPSICCRAAKTEKKNVVSVHPDSNLIQGHWTWNILFSAANFTSFLWTH